MGEQGKFQGTLYIQDKAGVLAHQGIEGRFEVVGIKEKNDQCRHQDEQSANTQEKLYKPAHGYDLWASREKGKPVALWAVA
jgi:hypothetical protein